jgi:cell division septation protein DedD
MQAKRRWVGILLLLSATAQAADLEVTRVENGVSVRHVDGSSTTLHSRDPLKAGDIVITGVASHVSVRLAGGGSLLLGDKAALQLNSSVAPDPPGRATLARLKLVSGALHVDARKSEQGAPADVHLGVGVLQARLYGTEAWAEHSAAGDEICLIAGAAEIDTPGAHQRLDSPGECLRWTAAGAQRLASADAGSLLPRLAATNFSDDYATRYAAQQAIQYGDVRPTLADSGAPAPRSALTPGTIEMHEVAPSAARAASPSPAAPPAAGGWRIVLGAYADHASATRAVRQWQRRKLSADITESQADGRRMFEVRCGHYASRAQAEQALARLRTRAGYEHARVVSLDAAAPLEAIATATSAAPAPAAPATVAAPAPQPLARPAAKSAAPKAPAKTWRISLGSFIDHANAARSVAQWKARDLQADIEPIRLKGHDAYRVLCGHYETRAQAEAALKRLRARSGYEEARVLTVPDALSKR